MKPVQNIQHEVAWSRAHLVAAVFVAVTCLHAHAEAGRTMGYRRCGVQMTEGRSGSATRSFLRGTRTASLPDRWDSREHGWVSRVKNQGNVGACWAFSACAVIETQLLKAGRGEWDLSEKNMVNLHGYNLGCDEGGDNYTALAYLLRWAGAVAETNDLYVSKPSRWTSSPQLAPAVRVQKIVWIPGRTVGVYDNEALKAAIMEYGAVSTSISWDFDFEHDDSYYCGHNNPCNHAITAVGWDDSYPARNFLVAPPGNGAWLIKNSWGTGNGSNGYYWVSYYDETFGTEEGAVFIPSTDEEDYDAAYGYDVVGAVSITADNVSETMEAAVFTSAWNEEVAAVGVYSMVENNPYEILVYTNVTRTVSTWSPNPIGGGSVACATSGTIVNMGYTTIHLPEPVKLADRTNFAVVYTQKGTRHPHIYSCTLSDEYRTYAEVHAVAGNTYWGRVARSARGAITNWTDLAVNDRIACLKAYTRSTVMTDGRPSESDDGTAALKWLAATNATLYAETCETFGASAGIVGANGRTLWTSWVAGFDPANADDGDLEVSITFVDNVPCIRWKPDLGSSARTYTVYGTESLSPMVWTPVEDMATTSARFFKVKISP